VEDTLERHTSNELATAFYRALARRLRARLDTVPARSGNTGAISPDSWLHPRAVWGSVAATAHQVNACAADLRMDLAAGTGPRPDNPEHLFGADAEPWLTAMISKLGGEVDAVMHESAPRLSADYDSLRISRIQGALRLLGVIWPEAAAENRLLVLAYVHTCGPAFRSGSMLEAFGAVFVGEASLTSEAAAVEMLLHETAHHSLYLRCAFTQYLENPNEVAAHSLRSDPRPMSGIVHAAHVLVAMATGMDRWCQSGGAPQEAFQRRTDALASLRDSLAVLDKRARWTPAGERYYANLVQRALQVAGMTRS